MKFRVLGGDGGVAKGFQTSSFLINDNILIDAGSAASSLTIEEQKKIDYIFITHSHLDHIKDLCFLADNVFAFRKTPVKVISLPSILGAIRKHLFNNTVWPDFSKLNNGRCNIVEWVSMHKDYRAGKVKIDHYRVAHPVPALGYILQQDGKSIVITGDTGPTNAIWKAAQKERDLRAIFTEIAFPDTQIKVAVAAGHFTPSMFLEEYEKIPKKVPIYIYHFKPAFYKTLKRQVAALKLPKLKLLKIGQRLNF